MGGRAAELGVSGSRDSQVRPPPRERANENGSRTPNCCWIGPSGSPDHEEPPEEEPPVKEVPPMGTGAGGGAVGVSTGPKGPSAGLDGSPPRRRPAAFATPSATLPTHPASSEVPLDTLATNPSTRPSISATRSGTATISPSTVRASPIVRRSATLSGATTDAVGRSDGSTPGGGEA